MATRHWTALLAASLATLLAPPAAAEDGPAPPPPPPPPAAGAAPTPAATLSDSDVGARTPQEASAMLDNLPDITVEAPTLSRRSLFETTAPVNAITRQTLEREMPRYFSDAVWNEPGLWNTQGSAGQMGTPVIRGSMGNQVLLLLDGVRLSNTLFTVGPGSDWDLVDMESLDHVEVVRSPDAVLYGTQGIGGATALYTAWPRDYTDCGMDGGARARLLWSTGGENQWRARLEGDVATPRFRAVAGGTWTDADDLVGGGGVGEMAPTRFETHAGDLRFEVRVGPEDTIGFSFFGMEKNWPDRFTNPTRDYDNWSARETGILRWRRTRPWALADEMELVLAAVHAERVYGRHDKYSREQQEATTPQADLVLRKRLGCGHQLTYGLHYHQDFISLAVKNDAGTIRSIPDGWLLTGGVYVQDEWQVSPRLRLTGGLRFDLSRTRTFPDADTTDPLIDPDTIEVDRSDSAWTGKLGAFYRLSDSVGLTGNLSRGYRFPGPNDLASFRQAPDEIQVGDPNLEPEYSTVLDVGLHVQRPRWRASVTPFVAWFDDLIVGQKGAWNGMTWIDRDGDLVQDADEDIYLRTNAGTATFYGLEASAEVALTPCWTLFGNFTWWHGEIDPDMTEPIGVPTNGTVGVRFEAGDRWWAEASCHLVATFDDIPAAWYDEEQFFWKDPQDPASGPLRDDHSVPGYALVDLRGGVRINDHVSVTAAVENVFDRGYRPYGSRHDGAGATFLLGASIDF